MPFSVWWGRYLRGPGHGLRAEAQHAPLPHDHPAADGAAGRDDGHLPEVPQEVHGRVRVGAAAAATRFTSEFVTAKETFLHYLCRACLAAQLG